MARKKEENEPVETPAPVVVKNVRAPRRVSFEQWATLRKIKQSHKGGMRAFVPNPSNPRPVEAWDKLFADY